MKIEKLIQEDFISNTYYINYYNDENKMIFSTICPSQRLQNILYSVLLECDYYPYKES